MTLKKKSHAEKKDLTLARKINVRSVQFRFHTVELANKASIIIFF